MNFRLYSGTVRCADCFDASSYKSETTDPCAYCGTIGRPAEPIATDEWIEAMSVLVVDPTRRFVQFDKIACSWCHNRATWKIVGPTVNHLDEYTCTDHGQEWYPDLFPTVTDS